MANEGDIPESAGWNAIDAAMNKVYPGQEPLHWGTLIKFCMGGNDPLDGTSAFRAPACENVPSHWHFVSYGMSELYTKESEDTEYSGWGFEFTFRLTRGGADQSPPNWALSVLQNLARYVYQSRRPLGPGHYMPLNGPIALGEKTDIHAVCFVEDPELGEINTPHGKVLFLQMVGLTMDELAAARAWDVRRFMSVMAHRNPLLVTDILRKSILSDPQTANTVAEGTARDGSSSGGLALSQLALSLKSDGTLVLTIGAGGVKDFQALLRGRIPFGRKFRLQARETFAEFNPGDYWNAAQSGEGVGITLPASAASTLADALKVQRGDYHVATVPMLTVRVVPTEIKDVDGKNVVEVIG